MKQRSPKNNYYTSLYIIVMRSRLFVIIFGVKIVAEIAFFPRTQATLVSGFAFSQDLTQGPQSTRWEVEPPPSRPATMRALLSPMDYSIEIYPFCVYHLSFACNVMQPNIVYHCDLH